MGAPDHPGFVCFEAGDLTVYVSRELLETVNLGSEQMPFYIDGYGRFWLEFTAPWRGLQEIVPHRQGIGDSDG